MMLVEAETVTSLSDILGDWALSSDSWLHDDVADTQILS